MIRLMLVDDHALIRQGLRTAAEASEDIEVVGEASSLAEARAIVRATKPDVLVVDVNLGDGSGLDLVRELRGADAGVGLVVLTMYDGDEHLFRALDAGASVFVLKSAPSDDVLAAVRHSATRPSSFTAEGLAGALRRRMAGPAVRLTPREDEILRLLAGGRSVAEVAGSLFISPSTAKTHISKLYEKLGASNRAHAMMEAVRLGLLDGSDASGPRQR